MANIRALDNAFDALLRARKSSDYVCFQVNVPECGLLYPRFQVYKINIRHLHIVSPCNSSM